MKYISGEQFLNKLYKNMYLEDIIAHKSNDCYRPDDKIKKYLNRLSKIHDIALINNKMNLLKSFYYNKYVIKKLPENYIRLQQEIALKNGHSYINKDALLLYVQKTQKNSLDKWIKSLSTYPMWFQVYVFRSVVKLNSFDKNTQSFGKRTNTTTSPFIEVNENVLKQVYKTISGIVGNDRRLSIEDVQALNNGESFKKIYTYYLIKKTNSYRYENIDGCWIKYPQGSDYRELLNSIENMQTGWCIDSPIICKRELEAGDFYIYYTKDEEAKFTIPRVAIRMKGKKILTEIRGIESKQQLEKNMIGIAFQKALYLTNKVSYQKRFNDMSELSKIIYKTQLNQELTINELKFLYEIDSRIDSFYLNHDSRIEKLKKKRSVKKDLALIFGCEPCNIGDKVSDFYGDNKIVAFVGNLKVNSNFVPERLKHLKYISGFFDCSFLSNADGLESLEYIGKDALFPQLISAAGLNNLKFIGGDGRFTLLRNAKGLEKLKMVSGNADFSNLIDTVSLNSLEIICNNADFSELENTKGLNSLKYIGKKAVFSKVTDATGLDSLSYIGGRADFCFLKESFGLEKLKYIGEDAYFFFLEDATGLNNLELVAGQANFQALKNSKGLDNLENIGGDATFPSLEEVKHLNKLKYIGESANFSEISNVDGLFNLSYIGKDALFSNLKNATSLSNLYTIGNVGYFNKLEDITGLEHLKSLGMKIILSDNNIEKLQPQIKEKVYVRSI